MARQKTSGKHLSKQLLYLLICRLLRTPKEEALAMLKVGKLSLAGMLGLAQDSMKPQTCGQTLKAGLMTSGPEPLDPHSQMRTAGPRQA